MITHLHVENVRILRNVDMELGPLNFLVGPNGTTPESLCTGRPTTT